MVARITTERILRDADDDSGQSVRSWTIITDPENVTIRLKHGDGFLLMRADDVDVFISDLQRAREMSLLPELAKD